ncbi:hypothetical protein CYMTET_24883 [Cymbomonas tetramitiformis]|uniref:Uncharacterized protein n=1 Tax=Cymbomonas tetramitiformis TaxID=36881 RepID=A0AAE0KZG2_9CHLO|nr:hypothetical protein CYMTET_24883 [Cymbomonas tetramitiformis]
MGAWPYIVVSDDARLRRWERQLGTAWYLADATKAKEPVQPFDPDDQFWRPSARARAALRRATLITHPDGEYKGIPYMGRRKPSMGSGPPMDPAAGVQARGLEAGEIPTVEAVKNIEISYVDLSDDPPTSPAYSPTSPEYCPTSPSESDAVVPDLSVCTVKDCVRCAQDRKLGATVDPIQETNTEHPAVETMTGGAGGSRGLVVDPPTSSDGDTDAAPRRMPKRSRKNVAPNRAKYPLAKYPRW